MAKGNFIKNKRNESKCIFWGVVTCTFIFSNANPDCEKCPKHIKENPHTIEFHSPYGQTGLNYISGIETTATSIVIIDPDQ